MTTTSKMGRESKNKEMATQEISNTTTMTWDNKKEISINTTMTRTSRRETNCNITNQTWMRQLERR